MSRPTEVTVLGIINIVWGALKFVNSLLGIVMLFAMPYFLGSVTKALSSMPPPPRGGPSPTAMFNMMKDPAYLTASGATVALNGIGGIILLAAGIGLLQMKNWGRLSSLVYAAWACMASVVSQIIQWTLMMPIMNRMMASMGGPGTPMPPASMMASMALVGVIFNIAFSMAYPIVLVVYMTRPWLVSAFTTIPAVVEATPAVTQEPPPTPGAGA
jgi:hypothetical protein